MDATVSTAINGQLSSWATDALSEFGGLIPVALGVVITVAVTFMLLRYFRAIVKI